VVAIGAIYATQALRERDVRSAATQAAAAAAPARATPAGEWLVVAGSFARGERAAAEQRRQLLAAAGVEASIVESNQFPLLAPNLLVVAVGPFESKDEVEAASRRARTVVPDAYPKRAR
jgi:cell division protein FtsN